MRVSPDSNEHLDIELDRWERTIPALHGDYASAQPFPHIVIDEFLEPERMARAAGEFDSTESPEWIRYVHFNEKKFSNPDVDTWGPTLQSLARTLNSPRFVEMLGKLTGIENLIADDGMEGGGLHQSLRGGFLNVHADFTVHPLHPTWRRRVNLLLYFNEAWPAEYGGALELWSTDMSHRVTDVAPIANRAVIFNTEQDSFHGHPEPLRCPPDISRRSLALYYFTLETDPVVRSTEYRARPGEGLRGVPIYLDKQVLRAYDKTKRWLGLSDQRLNGYLRRLKRPPKSRGD